MRRIFVLILFTLLCREAKADYGYMGLSETICEADYGVVGTIVGVDNNYFYLKVESVLMGRVEKDTIPIVKFVNWPCAHRYAEYKIGQREIVFFRRSNYVIDDYEFIGYGGGDEYELPITNDSTVNYQAEYNVLKSYKLNEFIIAVKDYGTLKERVNSTSKTITKEQEASFSGKSPLHKLFIEGRKRNDYAHEYSDDEMPKMGVIADIEKRFLYTDYENKIRVVFADTKAPKYYIKVDDADVRQEKDYFIIKPRSGWTRRFINVYNEGTDSILFNQIFEVIDLPEPRIYFGNHYWNGDTVRPSYYRHLIPEVHHYLDDLHYDGELEYKLLGYDYIIKSGLAIDTVHFKGAWATNSFRERIDKIKNGDIIELANVYVQYPNGVVVKLKGRTVYVNKTP